MLVKYLMWEEGFVWAFSFRILMYMHVVLLWPGLLCQRCECAIETWYSRGPGVLVYMSFDRSSDDLSGPLFLVRLVPAGKGMSVVVLKVHRLYRYRRSDGCSCIMHYSVGCPTCCGPFGYPIRGLWRHGLRCVFDLPARA